MYVKSIFYIIIVTVLITLLISCNQENKSNESIINIEGLIFSYVNEDVRITANTNNISDGQIGMEIIGKDLRITNLKYSLSKSQFTDVISLQFRFNETGIFNIENFILEINDKSYTIDVSKLTFNILENKNPDQKFFIAKNYSSTAVGGIGLKENYYYINLRNVTDKDIIIKDIILDNNIFSKTSLNYSLDNYDYKIIKDNFTIKPNEQYYIMVYFDINSDNNYYILQPTLKFTYDNQDYQRVLLPKTIILK